MTQATVKADQIPAAPKVVPSGVEITSIAVRGLRYYENAGPNSKTKFDEAWPEPGSLNFVGKLRIHSAETVEFSMWVRARLESGGAVFGIYIALSAMFSRESIIEARPFMTFINRQGAPILYPYVREIVTSLSAKSIYEPVVLPPLIIAPLVDDEIVDSFIANLEGIAGAVEAESEASEQQAEPAG